MRLMMQKKSSKYVLVLLCALFTHFAMQGVWWTASAEKIERPEQQHEGPQDYEEKYGAHLRDHPQLFPSIPLYGPIRWHHVLGVPSDANESEIKSARRKLLLATHTDKALLNGELIKAVNAVTDEINPSSVSMEEDEYLVVWEGTFRSQFGNFDQHGPGIVPPVDTLDEFFVRGGDKNKATQVDSDSGFTEDFKALSTKWKRFYAAKITSLAGLVIGYNYLKKRSESNDNSWFKKNKRIQKTIAWWSNFKKKHPKIAALLKGGGRGGCIALAAIYPLYQFRKFFTWSSLDGRYRSENMHDERISDDDLKLFYRMVAVGTRRYSNGETSTIYEPTFPVCYMTAEQERKEFI